MSSRHAESLRVAAASVLFLLSGAAALVYQVAWQRLLAFASGMGIYSVAVIVAAFMAGLGLGSHAGGLLSARLGRRGCLWAFALVELLVGSFAAASCTLYYDLLYVQAPGLYSTLPRAVLTHLAALAPPTILMGMSLPLLVRAMVRGGPQASRIIGVLYGANVLGAATGALLTPWVLIRHLGVPGAVLVGVAANAVTGLGALLLTLTVTRAEKPSSEGGGVASPPLQGPSLGVWAALYGTTGFLALALEVIWFRVVDVAVKSTAFTFGTVLALYLLGYGAGTLFGSWLAPRVRRPLGSFLTCQGVALAYAAAGLAALATLPADLPMLRWYSRYFAEYDGFRLGRVANAEAALMLYAVLPAALFAVPTFLMGVAFPILQRAVQVDEMTSGRRVGALQAANIAGCVAGSLVAGLGGLGWWGTTGTLRVLVAIGAALAAFGLVVDRRRRFAILTVGLAGAALALPSSDRLWRRLHGVEDGRAFFAEDATGVVALTPETGSRWRLSVNGRGNSTLPFGGVHSWLGAIPAVVHHRPFDVAIVGLGSGDTAWAAACRPETRRVDVFEISSPQLTILHALARTPEPPPRLRRLLGDPRIRVVIADGRNALERSGVRYDLIEMDALFPYSAFSGNLYSREFLELCARRLKGGGMVCAWAPSTRSHATFASVFAHVVAFDGGRVLIGSPWPIQLDVPAWLARLRSDGVTAHLRREVAEEVAAVLPSATLAASPAAVALNSDLFPRDEFATPLGPP